MDSQRMAQFLFAVLVLVRGFLCQALSNEGICQTKKTCPEYFLIATSNKDFENRLYVETLWITTPIKGKQVFDVMAAHNRLKHFCDRQKAQGYPMPDGWPVLITVVKVADTMNANMSWFVPNKTEMAKTSDTDVWLQTRPRGYVYVRAFGGMATFEASKENVEKLQDHLTKAGKSFVANHFSGAIYNSSWALNNYNEIWIAAP
ncbi:uncharacterized protein LOC127610715 [Hippocampus zosterae]|uniref:uncharacterized protein LOC127610715 n=1 Tax=Hippocampus zosterae TaxID=109293 RepID=UPI00223CB2BA|nr:uncharacterized protein LOC127610715 [Hippocampus zosterae]